VVERWSYLLQFPGALFSSRTGRQPLYHSAFSELRDWAYTGAPLFPLKGFPGIVWERPRRRKRPGLGWCVSKGQIVCGTRHGVKFSCWIFIARAHDSKYRSNEMTSYPLGSDAIQSLYDARQDGANPDDQHPRTCPARRQCADPRSPRACSPQGSPASLGN
jgi:hypothetical protein